MEELEITAKTVEQAVEEAENQLKVNRDQLEITVVKEGKSGVLGVGSEEAVIIAKPSTPVEEDVVEDLPLPSTSLSGEVDVAKITTEVLYKLLELIGVTGRVQVLSAQTPVTLNIEGADLGILIGRRGQTIASLEYIVKLIVAGRLKAWLPLRIDVAGYKERRRDSLVKLAWRLVEQVRSTRRSITLEPMPPDERRTIHMALADYPDVTTHSISEGDGRKVVISLKQS